MGHDGLSTVVIASPPLCHIEIDLSSTAVSLVFILSFVEVNHTEGHTKTAAKTYIFSMLSLKQSMETLHKLPLKAPDSLAATGC